MRHLTYLILYNDIKKTHCIYILFVLLLFVSCWYRDDDFNSNQCIDDSLNGSTNQSQLFFIEPERNIHFSFITLTASISVPNTTTYFGDEINLLQASFISEVVLEGFNHKDITLGNEINVLQSRLEEDGDAVLIYSEASDSYELCFEIFLERLGEYFIFNNDDLSLTFDTLENCSFRINTSSQRRFFVEQ